MLYVCDKDYLEKVLKFARNLNMEDQLLALLYRIGNAYHNNGEQYVCFLGKDFAPYSFGWSCFNLKDCYINNTTGEIEISYGKESWLNGGLIYSGPLPEGGENNDQNTLSISLNKRGGWSLHT
jgi:hypothetical protein